MIPNFSRDLATKFTTHPNNPRDMKKTIIPRKNITNNSVLSSTIMNNNNSPESSIIGINHIILNFEPSFFRCF